MAGSRKDIFEFIGLAAVVVGLVFVGVETRQANRIAEVESVKDYYEKLQGINTILMENPEFADLLVRETQEWSDLTRAEQVRVQSWNYYLLNSWLTANVAYKNDLLDKSVYGGIYNNIESELKVTSPAIRQNWRMIVNEYPQLQDQDVLKLIDSELRKYE